MMRRPVEPDEPVFPWLMQWCADVIGFDITFDARGPTGAAGANDEELADMVDDVLSIWRSVDPIARALAVRRRDLVTGDDLIDIVMDPRAAPTSRADGLALLRFAHRWLAPCARDLRALCTDPDEPEGRWRRLLGHDEVGLAPMTEWTKLESVRTVAGWVEEALLVADFDPALLFVDHYTVIEIGPARSGHEVCLLVTTRSDVSFVLASPSLAGLEHGPRGRPGSAGVRAPRIAPPGRPTFGVAMPEPFD